VEDRDGDNSQECSKCGVGMALLDGMEWPDDDSPLLCWGYQHDRIRELEIQRDRRRYPAGEGAYEIFNDPRWS
jgi:hypothetical protein